MKDRNQVSGLRSPGPLDEIRGQERALAEIRHRLKENTFRGSFLFTGPQGVGKHTCARAIAIELLAAGNEAAAGSVAAASHPDLILIEPDDKNSIRIDVARDLIRRMGLQAIHGDHKVAIIDRAEALTPEATNALLKVVEEPGQSGTFILVTHTSGALLPTLRSRCQQIRFQPLGHDVLRQLLQNNGVTSSERIAEVIPVAGGSLSQALQYAQWLDELELSFPQLFAALLDKNYTQLSQQLESLPRDPREVQFLLEGLRAVCRDLLLLVATDVDPAGGILFASQAPLMQKLAIQANAQVWLACQEAIGEVELALRFNTNPTIAWEALAFKMQASVSDNRAA